MQTLQDLKTAKQQLAEIEGQVLEDIRAKAELLGYQLVKADASQVAVPRQPSKPKYSDGNGNTWTGRGKRPAWITDALAQGRTLDDLATR